MDPGMEHAISALRMPSRIGGPPERRWPALKTRLSARIHVRAGTLEPRTSNKKQVWPNRSVLERFSYSSSASIAFLFTYYENGFTVGVPLGWYLRPSYVR